MSGMSDGEERKGRVDVRLALEAGRSSDGSPPVPPDPVAHVKDETLWAAVMDESWDTALAWADASRDLPSLDRPELDRIVRAAPLQAFDDELACFFEVTGFGESYSRAPSTDELLSRDALVDAFAEGSDGTVEYGSISAPLLGSRATERGREHVFMRWPEDRARWERFHQRQSR